MENQTATTRKLDELGRIILPVDLRKQLGWAERDSITMAASTDGVSVILTKADPYTQCALCGCRDKEPFVPITASRCLCRECIALVRTLAGQPEPEPEKSGTVRRAARRRSRGLPVRIVGTQAGWSRRKRG